MPPSTVEWWTKMMSSASPIVAGSALNGSLDVPVPGPTTVPFTYQIGSSSVKLTVTLTLCGTPAEGTSVRTYWKLSAPESPAWGRYVNRPFDSIVTLPPAVVVQTNGAVVSTQPTIPVTIRGLPSGSVSLSRTP